MGLLWDLMQQAQIGDNSSRSDSIEERVEKLEKLVIEVVRYVEKQTGKDINNDGNIG